LRAGLCMRRGLCSTAIGRCHRGTESGLIRAFRLVVLMHWVALRLIPRCRVALPDRVTDFAGQTKTPDLLEARGARIAQRVKVSRRYGKPPGTER
jgi:hypothetical protein